MAAVALQGTSDKCVRTPSPGTENGISTGSTDRPHPKANGTESDTAGGHGKVVGVGVGNQALGQRGREESSLPNGVPSGGSSEVHAGAAGTRPERASTMDGVQLRRNNGSSPDKVHSRPMSFRLRSQHGLLLTDEMKVDGEKMVVRLGEESIAWESARIGKGVCGGGGGGGLSYKLCQLRGLSSYELRYMHVGM